MHGRFGPFRSECPLEWFETIYTVRWAGYTADRWHWASLPRPSMKASGGTVALWKLAPLSEAPWEEGMSESVLFNLSRVYRYCGLSKCFSFSFFFFLSLFFLFFSVRQSAHPQNRCHIRRRYSYFQPSRLSIAPWNLYFSATDRFAQRQLFGLRRYLLWTKTQGRRRGAGGGGWGEEGGERKKTPEPKPINTKNWVSQLTRSWSQKPPASSLRLRLRVWTPGRGFHDGSLVLFAPETVKTEFFPQLSVAFLYPPVHQAVDEWVEAAVGVAHQQRAHVRDPRQALRAEDGQEHGDAEGQPAEHEGQDDHHQRQRQLEFLRATLPLPLLANGDVGHAAGASEAFLHRQHGGEQRLRGQADHAVCTGRPGLNDLKGLWLLLLSHAFRTRRDCCAGTCYY